MCSLFYMAWLITEGEYEGIVCRSEQEALYYAPINVFPHGAHYWISNKKVPNSDGFQELEYIPMKWRLFVEGFRTCESLMDLNNGQTERDSN